MSKHLKPCPFCGSKIVYFNMSYMNKYLMVANQVKCNNCGSSSGIYFSTDECKSAWNTRAEVQS